MGLFFIGFGSGLILFGIICGMGWVFARRMGYREGVSDGFKKGFNARRAMTKRNGKGKNA